MRKAGKKKPKVFISIKKSQIPLILGLLLLKLEEEDNP